MLIYEFKGEEGLTRRLMEHMSSRPFVLIDTAESRGQKGDLCSLEARGEAACRRLCVLHHPQRCVERPNQEQVPLIVVLFPLFFLPGVKTDPTVCFCSCLRMLSLSPLYGNDTVGFPSLSGAHKSPPHREPFKPC